MNKLQFSLLKESGNARVGRISLNGIEIDTPIFMPVGTKATIKGMILDLLQDPRYIGDLPAIQLILANTFHLYLRPGADLVKKAGGLHDFEKWKGLILTDSGGFQVFSLGLQDTGHHGSSKQDGHQVAVKLHDDGVSFCSPHDGSKHYFTPKGVVDIQSALGSDIMMMLDVCSPAGSDKQTFYQHMLLTHAWAKEQYDYMDSIYSHVRGVLFPIVQGGSDLELREESLSILSSYARDGIAVGGVSVGEPDEIKKEVISFCGPRLSNDVPRYLMGVGTPEDLLFAVEHGFDMFDCVLATRLGRHGVAFSKKSGSDDKFVQMKLRNAQYREDFSLLTEDCPCYVCQTHTRAYIHHLIREKEMLAGILLSLHNIVFLHKLLFDRRKKVLAEN